MKNEGIASIIKTLDYRSDQIEYAEKTDDELISIFIEFYGKEEGENFSLKRVLWLLQF